MKDIFQLRPVLTDERAELRAITMDDISHLRIFSREEPELWKYGLVTAAGEENLRNYVSRAVELLAAGKEYTFIVYDRLKQRYAGSTRFYDIQNEFDTAQLGYTWYGKEFQRTGLNRHCKYLLLQFAFETWGLERLEFRAHSANTASLEAMKAIGCTVEGVLRSHMPTVDGSRRDSVVLSVLKEEWFERVKEGIRMKM